MIDPERTDDLMARLAAQGVQIAKHESRIVDLERRVKFIDDWIFWAMVVIVAIAIGRWLFA